MDANVQWVFTSTFLLGLASGMIGSFALLKKQSLLGDAMAHAALPGVCLAFLLYKEKSLFLFFIGAALSGLLATFFIQQIVRFTRVKEDTAIGLVLSVFFGIGIVLLTFINQHSQGNQSGINDFLFGQAASLIESDVKMLSAVALTLIALIALFFKEFKLITFDPAFARGLGLPVSLLNGVLMFLIVAVVVTGLQAVGVVLMSALLITPALAARYWTEELGWMVVLAGLFGGLSGVIGTYLSTLATGMPTGPLIIVAATILFLFSFLFAPKRGLLSKAIRLHRLRCEHVLKQLYEQGRIEIEDYRYLKWLEKRGFVCKEQESWYLTEKGIKRVTRSHENDVSQTICRSEVSQ
uniref:Manganese transport system membrane protein MntC n=1 Tax=Geobacillus sp. (strain WCH70) TaxID=471223 RepID=C5DAB5_GEOSW